MQALTRRSVLRAAAGIACTASLNKFSVAGSARGAPPHIRRLAETPDDRIDIGEASFQLGAEFYRVDIPANVRRLQQIVERVAWHLYMSGSVSDPRAHIQILNLVLFSEQGLAYDYSVGARANHLNYFLHSVLDRKVATCVGLPLAYVAVAQRAGFPVNPVFVPDHVFARYDTTPPLARANIECTRGGKFVSNGQYVIQHLVSQRGLESGAYLRSLSRREHLGSLFYINAGAALKRHDYGLFVWYGERSLELAPRDAFAQHEFGRLFGQLAAMEPMRFSALRKRGQQLAERAAELGYVPAELIPGPSGPGNT